MVQAASNRSVIHSTVKDTPTKTADNVFRTYYHEVRRGLRRLNVPQQHVDDAAQDVFVVVHRRWSEFEGRSSHRTWVWSITTRVAAEYRRKRVSLRNKLAELAKQPTESPLTPERLAHAEEASRLVLDALDALSIADREVLVCVALEGFTVTESSKLLGIPMTTAASRYKKALHRFSREVKKTVDLSQVGGSTR